MDCKFLSLSAAVLGLAASASALTVNTAAGWLESAYAEWQPVSGASSYNVYVDGTKIDDPLIRSYGSYMRADVVGLKAGSHTLKIVPVVNGAEGAAESKTVSVKAHDRTGFAFSNGRVPGAYNTDGTLKSGAVVVYVSENSKNKVTADVVTNSKGTKTTCKSFQGILNCMKKGYETRPFDFRFIGNVTDSDSLVAGDMLIDLGSSEDSYVTIEGIGEDATANGWGIRIKNAQNVEVRNMGVMNVNSSEGDNIGLQQNDQYIWIHNNDMFYGDAGSDADQVKGDGALDCKKSTYVTFSYNHFWDNGKSNLLGLSEGTTDGYYITYHHNWYDHSDSRHPRVRYYSAHVYNNYYDGNAKYGAGSTLGSSVFMEGNYFRNCKFPMLTSMQGSDLYAGTTTSTTVNATFSKEAGGTIKAYNNKFAEGGTFIAYGATTYRLKGVDGTAVGSINTKTDFDAYVVSKRDEQVPATVVSKSGGNKYNNFDVNTSVMYKYTADEPDDAKANVMTYAGRINGGDFKWTFTAEDDALYAVNQALKNKLVAYTGSVKSIQGDGAVVVTPAVPNSSSGTASSPSSSASVEPSSSATVASSSSVSGGVVPNSSSATVEAPADDPVDESSDLKSISADLVHNFTEEGASSDYFEFLGNLSTSKGTVSYNGAELTRCLKIESATSVEFVLAKSAEVTLVFNGDFAKVIKIDGEKYTATAGVVKVKLAAGKHSITKGDSANLFLISVKIDASADEPGSSSSDDPASSSEPAEDGPASSGSKDEPSKDEPSEGEETGFSATVAANGNPLMYNVSECRLDVFASEIRRLDVVRMDGRKVRLNGMPGGVSYDLSHLQPGIYLVRLVADGKTFQRKIVKQ
ncbi:T9SS type A sorting domain-containing protein [Fibrobacter sp. UWH6]|uniref:pectate lyase family protein n=1 Tax=Fibrobacter sp. (strain UWH6) TaxID=1896212 RepID=UPI001114E675|nr:T9SS type A sorting domain-containing protein [Fibrobacter sp. UWH6]